MKISVHSLSLFVSRAARPFSTAPCKHFTRPVANSDVNEVMNRVPMADPEKPYQRLSNGAVRGNIAFKNFELGRVSFEEVGQVILDVAVEAAHAAQPTLVKIVGAATKEGSENFKKEELGGHIKDVLDAIKGVKGDLEGLKKNLVEVKGDLEGLKKEVKGDLEGLKKEVKGDLEGLKKDLAKVVTATEQASHNTQARISNATVSEDGDILSHLYTPAGELPTKMYPTFGDLKAAQLYKKVAILERYNLFSLRGKSDELLRHFMGLPRDVAKFLPPGGKP
jgi:hypothetical protein